MNSCFHIGTVTIIGFLALAPMDGVSDSPFRQIAKRHGANLLFSEFINAIDVVEKNPNVTKKLIFSEKERPIGIQIYDHQPERLLIAARHIVDNYQPDFIDLNLGCANRRVISRGAGAALLDDPESIKELLQLLTTALEIPVTAKIRLSSSDSETNSLQIAKIIEESGAKALSVHARTIRQGHSGEVNWDSVAEIKMSIKIPVIGNGSIKSSQHAKQIMERTRCDAAMIGRAAIGNPWIFSEAETNPPSRDIIIQTIFEHLDLSLSHYGVQNGLFFFRKHLKQYLKLLNLGSETQLTGLTISDHQKLITWLKGVGRSNGYF